jgi:hypothetical protein
MVIVDHLVNKEEFQDTQSRQGPSPGSKLILPSQFLNSIYEDPKDKRFEKLSKMSFYIVEEFMMFRNLWEKSFNLILNKLLPTVGNQPVSILAIFMAKCTRDEAYENLFRNLTRFKVSTMFSP